jgi:Protein of unknown function, DUF547
MSKVVKSILNRLEGWVASKKVNAGREISKPKLAVGPDSDYTGNERFDHSAWDSVMRKHVSPGTIDGIHTNVVDYNALAKDENFHKYCASLAEADLSSLPPNELLAFYINTYNALCISHVVRFMKEHQGKLPSSITKVTSSKGRSSAQVWDLPAGMVGGKTLTLNDIEHKILRSRWAEPRVHASIVCASASCPNLRPEAFVASMINAQMDDQARDWVTNPTKGIKVNPSKQTTRFSRIFLWFQDDFLPSGGLIVWANQYLPSDQKLSPDMSMDYFAYNWSLNKKSD